MDFEELIPESHAEQNPFEREDRCRKAIKTVGKAIFMRLFICGLLIWAALRTSGSIWVIGLLVLVMIMNLTGIFPLAAELKKQKKELEAILEEDM